MQALIDYLDEIKRKELKEDISDEKRRDIAIKLDTFSEKLGIEKKELQDLIFYLNMMIDNIRKLAGGILHKSLEIEQAKEYCKLSGLEK